ncbi:MAG: chorismate mutase [Simkaniaceae bacterium]
MEIETLREEIDLVNEEIIALLAKRKAMTKKMAHLKKERHLPVYDGNREAVQTEKVRQTAKLHHLDPDVVEGIFSDYVAYCRREMEKVCKYSH